MTVLHKAAALILSTVAVASYAAHAQETRDPSSAATERLINLRLPSGEDQRLLLVSPAKPKAVIVMLPGGSGDIGLKHSGDIRHDDNFVVRTRALWTARGYAVVIPDTIDGANLRGMRSSPEYADLVLEIVKRAHDQVVAPLFLLGTSQGAIAAMNGAAHAPAGSVTGVVLTESVSVLGGSRETVFDADPQDVRVPALVVANQDDACDVAPPAMAPKIAAAMRNSPNVKVEMVSGGMIKSTRSCGSLTPHGYYGIEEQTVSLIDSWMTDKLR